MELKSTKRNVIHRGSAWSNEEHSMLFHFWRQNIDKIDLPGRTEDKLKARIYGQMQEAFAKQGFRRSIKQIRKKIQNLKMEAGKLKDGVDIDDENVRVRVKAVQEILALTDAQRTPVTTRTTRSTVEESTMAVTLFADANGSAEQWIQELHPSAITSNDQDFPTSTPG